MKNIGSIISVVLALALVNAAKAQLMITHSNTRGSDTSIFIEKENSSITRLPSYPGGADALFYYLQSNLKYPKLEKKEGIEGTVVVCYYINNDGSIEDVSIVAGLSPGLDEEALRLVRNMSSWIPAWQNGGPGRVKYQLPITFQLNF